MHERISWIICEQSIQFRVTLTFQDSRFALITIHFAVQSVCNSYALLPLAIGRTQGVSLIPLTMRSLPMEYVLSMKSQPI